MPPTPERIKQNRNQNRLQRSIEQIKYAREVCNWLVINDNLEKSTNEIEKVLQIIHKSGENVEKIPHKDIEFLYKKSMKNPKNKSFLEKRQFLLAKCFYIRVTCSGNFGDIQKEKKCLVMNLCTF